MDKQSLSYLQAGVDTKSKDKIIEDFFSLMRSTYDARTIQIPWSFAGFFKLNIHNSVIYKKYKKPVLVACSDGVGTKVKFASIANKFDTIGIDLVAMNVNDLIVHGAEPLFLLDYIAFNKLEKPVLLEIFKGIVEGCKLANCTLLGGETAEMPGFFNNGCFEINATSVGIVEQKKIVTGKTIKSGDVIIGLLSNGLHSNGFSLVRKLFLKDSEDDERRCKDILFRPFNGSKCLLIDELLKPTHIYSQAIVSLLSKYQVKRVIKGMAHITGGGIKGNLERIIPPGLKAVIYKKSWQPHDIFSYLQNYGNIPDEEMFNVFNMGIGFIIVVNRFFADSIVRFLKRKNFQAQIIGEIHRGKVSVEIC